MTVEAECAAGRIAYSHRNDGKLIKHVVQIIPPVRPDSNIRGIQAHASFRIEGVIRGMVNDPFIPPVSQVLRRGRPADIIIQAKHVSVKPVMRAVNIHPSIKYIRLTVRDIFP
jgi:hypothetical protein